MVGGDRRIIVMEGVKDRLIECLMVSMQVMIKIVGRQRNQRRSYQEPVGPAKPRL